MDRQKTICDIRDIIECYGSFNICEVDNCDHAIVINTIGEKVQEVVDAMDRDGISSTVYIDNTYIKSNIYYYEELTNEVLSEILIICKQYQEL